jgi:hypothetical protein
VAILNASVSRLVMNERAEIELIGYSLLQTLRTALVAYFLNTWTLIPDGRVASW